MAQQPEEPSGFSALVKADYFTLTDGTRFYYELHGSGPQKIVFIAGTSLFNSLATKCLRF